MIAIIDYGLGNIKAFANVYKNLNMQCKIVSNAKDLLEATKIILPGVGAFDYAMTRLHDSGMVENLNRLVMEEGVPVLGVCVGMQMLAHSSDEGELPGLGWIPGEVKKFDVSKCGPRTPLPHMGWNNVVPVRETPLFNGLGNQSIFYFLHSYYFQCHDQEHSLAMTDYGISFTSAVGAGNVFGVQFHPEKSHQYGMQLLKNFGEL